MRIESDGGRHGVNGFRAVHNRLHNALVSEMQTVKNAERQNRRARDVRIVRAVKNFHFYLKPQIDTDKRGFFICIYPSLFVPVGG